VKQEATDSPPNPVPRSGTATTEEKARILGLQPEEQVNAVAVNLQQLRTTRFDGAPRRGTVPAQTMARVDQALRAVLDL
jgi:hypothetical protein